MDCLPLLTMEIKNVRIGFMFGGAQPVKAGGVRLFF